MIPISVVDSLLAVRRSIAADLEAGSATLQIFERHRFGLRQAQCEHGSLSIRFHEANEIDLDGAGPLITRLHKLTH
jgi:hypothetical protein